MGKLLKTDQDNQCRVIRTLHLVHDASTNKYWLEETDLKTKITRISGTTWTDEEAAMTAYRRGSYGWVP